MGVVGGGDVRVGIIVRIKHIDWTSPVARRFNLQQQLLQNSK
jgi:hypothetical protein